MQQTILVKPDVKGFYESRTGSIQYVVSDPITGRSAIIDPVLDFDEKSGATANMTISLAFLAPDLIEAAVEGRLPPGIGIERLRDLLAEWSRQFGALGLNPE